jgi:hypothetical protein
VGKLQTAAMVGLPFIARVRSSGGETTQNRRPIASIAPHLFKKLAERAKETFGRTSVPETLLARHDATRFKPKTIQKGKGLVLRVASSTSEVAVETPVHGKVALALKHQGNSSKEFVSTRDSEFAYTRAINVAQYVQRQFELGSIMQVMVITLTMVACCIRAAKCYRKLMTQVSIGKQTDEKAIKDRGGNAKDKTLESAQKKSPESSARRFLSSEKEFKVSVAVREESSETETSTRGPISSSARASIDSDEGTKEDDQHPISPGMGTVNDIPCVSSLVIEGDKENECFDRQATSLESESIKLNAGRQGSPDRKQEDQGTPDTLDVSRKVTVGKGTEEGSDATPVSHVTCSAVEVSPPLLWRDSSPGREQEKIGANDALGPSSQINLDDDGEEEEKKEDFESKSLHLVIRGDHEGTPAKSSMERQKQEQPLFDMTDWSPRAPEDKNPVEVSDPEQIFSVSRSAIEATPNSLLRDCPSLETTSLDSSISSDGELTNSTGGSSSTSTGSPGRSVKRISFCPSPPQVREFERYYYMDRKHTSRIQSDTPVQFNNWNKKCRMLKKKLDKLNGDGEALDVPLQGTQTVTRTAKKLGQAFLMVSASVLSQRR